MDKYLFKCFSSLWLMLFMFIPLHVFSEDVQSISGYCGANGDNLVWTFTKSDSSLVIKGSGDMADYGTVDAPWQKYSMNIKQVIVAEGVSYIGISAFENMYISKVELPSSLKKMGQSVFASNINLNSIYLPDSITEIPSYAFYHCKKLSAINLDKVRKIGGKSFVQCNLTEIHCSDQLECIEQDAFWWCSKLKKFSLPKEYKKVTLDVFAFESCEQLEEVDLGRKGILSLLSGTFRGCVSLKNVVMGDSVIIADDYARDGDYYYSNSPFYECPALHTIVHNGVLYHVSSQERDVYTVPSEVKTIETQAFKFSQAKKVILSINMHDIKKEAFADNKYIETVDFSNCSYLHLGKLAFGRSALSKIVDMEKVTWMGEAVFAGCSNLSGELLLNDSIFKPVSYAMLQGTFNGCENLESIVLPNVSNLVIGDNAFYGCRKLKHINLENIVSLGFNTFYGCSSLDSLSFYKLQDVCVSSFNNCATLKISLLMDKVPTVHQWKENSTLSVDMVYVPIYLEEKYKKILDAKIFGIEENLSGYCGELGNNVHWSLNTKEGVLRFEGTGSITKFDLSPNPNYSRINACKKVEIDSRINKIGTGAFVDYTLKDIVLSDNISEIGDSAFNRAKINKVIAGKRLERIGKCAFYDSSIKEFVNGEYVSCIDKMAFCNSQLRKIRFSNRLKIIKEGAFASSQIDSLIIPDSTKLEGKYIALNCPNLHYVVLPKDLLSLPRYFLANNKNVHDVYIKSCEIYNSFGWGGTPTLHIPMGSLGFYQNEYTTRYHYDELYSLINCAVASHEYKKHGHIELGNIKIGEEIYHEYYERGDSFLLKFCPDKGCHLDYVMVNNKWVENLSKDSLIFDNLQESKNIYVYFARNEYGLSVESTKGGKIRVLNNDVDIAASYKVLYDDTVHFEFLPNEGYELEKVLLNHEDITQKVEENLFDLTISGDNKLKVFYKDSTSSSIDKITFDTDIHKTPLYNINGQRISNEYKGIRVKKGKKWIGK